MYLRYSYAVMFHLLYPYAVLVRCFKNANCNGIVCSGWFVSVNEPRRSLEMCLRHTENCLSWPSSLPPFTANWTPFPTSFSSHTSNSQHWHKTSEKPVSCGSQPLQCLFACKRSMLWLRWSTFIPYTSTPKWSMTWLGWYSNQPQKQESWHNNPHEMYSLQSHWHRVRTLVVYNKKMTTFIT